MVLQVDLEPPGDSAQLRHQHSDAGDVESQGLPGDSWHHEQRHGYSTGSGRVSHLSLALALSLCALGRSLATVCHCRPRELYGPPPCNEIWKSCHVSQQPITERDTARAVPSRVKCQIVGVSVARKDCAGVLGCFFFFFFLCVCVRGGMFVQ